MMQAESLRHLEAVKMLAKSPLISAAGIGVHRAGRWLIRNVDLSVSPGRSSR
jgi:ABC-type molybdenum transport system ATPase subunit/photorepair protein PhrA